MIKSMSMIYDFLSELPHNFRPLAWAYARLRHTVFLFNPSTTTLKGVSEHRCEISYAITVSTESLIIPFMKNPTYRISIIVEQSEFDDGESLKLNFVFNFHLGKSST